MNIEDRLDISQRWVLACTRCDEEEEIFRIDYGMPHHRFQEADDLSSAIKAAKQDGWRVVWGTDIDVSILQISGAPAPVPTDGWLTYCPNCASAEDRLEDE